MLKCEEVKPLLSEYIDHELSLWKMQMVRVHLKTCPCCSRELAQLRDTDSLLKLGQDEITTSDHFTDDVMDMVSVISRSRHNHAPLFQRFIGKIKTYAVWFRYSLTFRGNLSFVWSASFTLLLLILIGLFGLSPFYRSNSGKTSPSGLVPKHKLEKKAKTVNFIEIEFVKPTHRSKKNLPSFDS